MTRPHVAFGVLRRKGRMLLVHRNPNRAVYPDCWDFPGGHVEPGETALAAVRRELREEIGVDATRWSEAPFPNFFPHADTTVFLIDAWDGEPANLQPDEHDTLGWFTADELADLTMADPRMNAWSQSLL